MTRLLIWRHGQTAWNALRRTQGQLDIDLNDIGLEQASAAAAMLAARRPDLIVSSDLSRCASTAGFLSLVSGQPVALDKRLRERDFGPWQGLLPDEIEQRWPQEYEHWQQTGESVLPGIESVEDLAGRAAAAFADAAEQVGDGLAVAVTHGGAAKAGTIELLGWPVHAGHALKVLDNCHWTELRRTSMGWQLFAHNVGFPHT
jgi:glucosyl-3-phosphoglycerate phosphatase